MELKSLRKFYSGGTKMFRKRSTKMELKSLKRFHSDGTKKCKERFHSDGIKTFKMALQWWN